MKTLTAALIIEKNKLANTVPWIVLLRVTLDDATVLKLAAYPSDVVFDSETYTAFPLMLETIKDSAQSKIETVRVSAANVNRLISSYVENADLLGNAVTIRIVHADHLDDSTQKIDYTYRINRISITAEVATFELGFEDLMRLQLPSRRYMRGRCRWIYGDAHCEYPDDEFSGTSKQTLKDERTTGSPFERVQGWYVYNAHECDTFDIGVTAAGYLTAKNKTGAVKDWYGALHDTAYAYKHVSGDFDVETLLVNTAFSADGLAAHLLVQSDAVLNDWISICWYYAEETEGARLLALSTEEGTAPATSVIATCATWYRYARITRSGNAIAYYGKAATADAWTEIGTTTRADLGSPARVGFTLCARSAATPATTVQWDYLRVNAGGLATCDYTIDGANGCRAHKNTIRGGFFPAIPSGRLYGI